MNSGYGISNIKILGYTEEEIKKINESEKDRQYNELIKKKEEELNSKLGLSPECLNSEYSNYATLKVENELYNKCVYKISGSTIAGPIRKPEFHFEIKRI